MKNTEELAKIREQLTETELKKLDAILENLKTLLKTQKISEEGLRNLTNIIIELTSLKESYTWRIIKLLKQNQML